MAYVNGMQAVFQEKLAKRFPFIADGLFSSVYGKPGSDKVIKVSRDRAWLAYMIWANETSERRRFAPILYSVKWHANGHDPHAFYVAIMERVTPQKYMASDHPRKIQGRMLPTCLPHVPGFDDFRLAAREAGINFGDCHNGNWGYKANGDLCVFDPTTGTDMDDLPHLTRRYRSSECDPNQLELPLAA